ARTTGRVQAIVENPGITELRTNITSDRDTLIRKLRTVDFSEWTVHAAGLQQLDPPVLVRENIGIYNIVRFGPKFYGFPQSEGSFIPEKAAGGEYDVFPASTSLPELLARLHSTTQSKQSDGTIAVSGGPARKAGLHTLVSATFTLFGNFKKQRRNGSKHKRLE